MFSLKVPTRHTATNTVTLRSLVLKCVAVVSISFAAGAAPANAAVIDVCSVADIERAMRSVAPGDVVRMCNGTWKDAKIVFDVRGTKAAPITLRARTPGKVILTGSSQLYMSGKWVVVDGLTFKGRYTGSEYRVLQFQNESNITCTDCRLTNTSFLDYSPADASFNTKWVVLHGSRNRVDHCHFRGKTNLGAMVQIKRNAGEGPNNHLIDHNLFENRPDLSNLENVSQNGDTLEIGSQSKFAYGVSGSTVEYNYLRNINSDYEIVTLKSSGNTVRYNVIDSSSGVLSLRQGTDNTIDGNFIFGRGKSGTGGIRITGDGHVVVNNYIADINPGQIDSRAPLSFSTGTNTLLNGGSDVPRYYDYEVAKNVTAAHNTIVNSGAGIQMGHNNYPVKPHNNKVHANLLSNITGRCIEERNAGSNLSYRDNICHAPTVTNSKNGFDEVNPRLALGSDGLHRPRSGSPAVNGASASTPSGMKDMDGQNRTAPYDIGADEYKSGGTGRGPVSTCDVGPTTYSTSNDCAVTATLKPPTNLVIM